MPPTRHIAARRLRTYKTQPPKRETDFLWWRGLVFVSTTRDSRSQDSPHDPTEPTSSKLQGAVVHQLRTETTSTPPPPAPPPVALHGASSWENFSGRMLRSALMRLTPAGAASQRCSWHTNLGTFAMQPLSSTQQQSRSVVSVKVYPGKLQAAQRALTRVLMGDKVFHAWRKKEYYLKPAAQRVEDQKATAQRLKKRQFKEHMRLALQRKDRCGRYCRLA